MKKIFKKQLSVLLAAIMLLGAFALPAASAAQTNESVSAASSSLPERIDDGAILHTFCWSFNTIKENIPDIAAAGFKAVQTSPINKINASHPTSEMKSDNKGNWWYIYQPISYSIGNYMLGTLEEFEDMCNTAHEYGVKVVVDIVANHFTSDYSKIEAAYRQSRFFHPRLEISDWSNRKQVTQGKLTGLYDLNTQSEEVQDMVVEYLQAVLDAGADGFRFDAAKHIELPDDDEEYAGDFWTVVLDNDAEFQYGEILAGGDRAADYAKIMRITAESYGTNLRQSLVRNQMTKSMATNYRIKGVNADRFITWVESHDNYCSDDNSTYSTIDNSMIRRGWAVIAAQGDTTPLFFNRPAGSSTTSQWGVNKTGIAGDDNWKHPEVVEVNKFRNATVGEGKEVTEVVSKKLLSIQRGDKGTVLINFDTVDHSFTTAVKMADGEYTDQVTGASYTVKDGKLSGTVKAGAVAVVYNPPEEEVLVGDVDNDGKVTINDVTALQRYLADYLNSDGSAIVDEKDEKAFKRADVDGNGVISIDDATQIQRILAGL